VPVEDRADSEVEGHHAQFVRGSCVRYRPCGIGAFVTGASAQEDER